MPWGRPEVRQDAVAAAERCAGPDGDHERSHDIERCGCRCHQEPWPFEAEGYTPPEREW